MRQPRSIFTLAALATVPAAVAVGVFGGSSSVSAAATPTPVVSAPVASAPQVVAHAVSAPKRAAAAATHKATVTHHAVTRTAPKRASESAVKVAAKPATKAPVSKPAPKPTTTSAVRTGNDYPYASATTNANDKWGFTERQCVSFAAWRLAREGRAISNAQGWGSAFNWDDTARKLGVRVSTTPHVGAIAQWNVGESGKVFMNGGTGTFTAGEYGHVGYVAAVYSDGSALIEQYNVQGDREYSVLRMTAPRYLF